jgi:hypothetical protein
MVRDLRFTVDLAVKSLLSGGTPLSRVGRRVVPEGRRARGALEGAGAPLAIILGGRSSIIRCFGGSDVPAASLGLDGPIVAFLGRRNPGVGWRP